LEDPWDRATQLPLVKSCSWRMGGSLMLLFGASSRRIPGSVRRSLWSVPPRLPKPLALCLARHRLLGSGAGNDRREGAPSRFAAGGCRV